MNKALKWINAAAFTLMLLVNILANTLPIGGKTTGEISRDYPNLFSPAAVTFSIWGLIYLLLLVFVLYQSGIFDKGWCSSIIAKRIGLLFPAGCLLNTLWLLCWHSDRIGAALICIILLLICLIMIERKIAGNREPFISRLYVNAGFDIYYGWIIAALIANVSVFLVKTGWTGFGLPQQFWTVIVLLTGALIASAVVEISRIRLAGFAVIWAYTGILIQHISKNGFAGQYPAVISAAIIGIALILLSVLRGLVNEAVFGGCLPAGRTESDRTGKEPETQNND